MGLREDNLATAVEAERRKQFELGYTLEHDIANHNVTDLLDAAKHYIEMGRFITGMAMIEAAKALAFYKFYHPYDTTRKGRNIDNG